MFFLTVGLNKIKSTRLILVTDCIIYIIFLNLPKVVLLFSWVYFVSCLHQEVP